MALPPFRVFLNVSMLFSPCLRYSGRKGRTVALESVCHVIPSKVLNIMVWQSHPSAIFAYLDLHVPKQNFVANCQTDRLRKTLVVGPGSLKSKEYLMTDLSWLSESRSPGIALAAHPWLLTRQNSSVTSTIGLKPHSEPLSSPFYSSLALSSVFVCRSLRRAISRL